MQLVGAAEELIQAPFVIDGMIQGLTGAPFLDAALWGYFCAGARIMVPTLGVFLGPRGQLQFLDPRDYCARCSGGLLGSVG